MKPLRPVVLPLRVYSAATLCCGLLAFAFAVAANGLIFSFIMCVTFGGLFGAFLWRTVYRDAFRKIAEECSVPVAPEHAPRARTSRAVAAAFMALVLQAAACGLIWLLDRDDPNFTTPAALSTSLGIVGMIAAARLRSIEKSRSVTFLREPRYRWTNGQGHSSGRGFADARDVYFVPAAAGASGIRGAVDSKPRGY